MRERERGGRERVRDDVRRHRAVGAGEVREVVERAELGRVRVPQPGEPAVDEDVLDDADLPDRGRAEREADRDAAVDDVGLADEVLGRAGRPRL